MYLIVIVLFAGIVASLGSALVYLLRSGDNQKRLGVALSWRIGLSVFLFVLLMLAWMTGLIHPHGVVPGTVY